MKQLIVISFMLLVFCQNHVAMPQNAAQQYGSWFVSPHKSAQDSLCSYAGFIDKQDSLAVAAKKLFEGKTGAFTTILTDTQNATYTVGWKTPKQIRHDTTYPLIIYLHGGTGTMLSTKGEFAWDMLTPLSDTFDLFLASPSSNRETPWWSPAGMERIMQTIRFMTLSYPVNPDKIFLAGVSDGATGTYAVANTIGSPFAGFIAVSGYGGMLFQLGMNLYPPNLAQRPIVNINAGQDRIFPIAVVRQFTDWLTANGVNVDKTEYPNEQHGFDYRPKEFGHLANCIRTWHKPQNTLAAIWSIVKGFPNVIDNCTSFELSKESTDPKISAYWKNDTFMVKSTGLHSATFSFPAVHSQDIFASINGSSAKKISALRNTGEQILNTVQHSFFPQIQHCTLYKIELE